MHWDDRTEKYIHDQVRARELQAHYQRQHKAEWRDSAKLTLWCLIGLALFVGFCSIGRDWF
jgi:hypothetical protein